MNPIEMAVAAAAKAQADAVQAAQSQTTDVAVASAPTQGSVSVAVKAPKLSMESVSGGAMTVDAWLKPKETGLQVGDAPELFNGLKVSLNMVDGKGFVVKKGIKAGNPAQYAYTDDGATCITGGSWEAACAKIRALEPNKKTDEYRCVDLPMTCVEDFFLDQIVDKKVVPKLLVKAGTMLGYTTATTGWKAWVAFQAEVDKKGLMGQEVVLTVGSEARSNPKGNKWGTMTFELIGALDEYNATE